MYHLDRKRIFKVSTRVQLHTYLISDDDYRFIFISTCDFPYYQTLKATCQSH